MSRRALELAGYDVLDEVLDNLRWLNVHGRIPSLSLTLSV
jgi:hypothetical protein